MNEQPVSIRPADGGDLRALCKLTGELGYSSTLEAVETRFEKLMEAPGNAVFVAVAETRIIVGWVHVFGTHRIESDTFAELGGLIVSDEHRRRGIGRALLDAARRWAESNGYVKLRVRSRADRDKAHRFFERSGLAHTKTQKIFDATLNRGDREH